MDLIPLAAVREAVDDLLGEIAETEIDETIEDMGIAMLRPDRQRRLMGRGVK